MGDEPFLNGTFAILRFNSSSTPTCLRVLSRIWGVSQQLSTIKQNYDGKVAKLSERNDNESDTHGGTLPLCQFVNKFSCKRHTELW